MRARALSIVTLAAATLGAAGCRSSGAGDFFGAVLGTAAVVMIESYDNEDDGFHYEHHHHEDRCRRRR